MSSFVLKSEASLRVNLPELDQFGEIPDPGQH
jgi:hypothetical protein